MYWFSERGRISCDRAHYGRRFRSDDAIAPRRLRAICTSGMAAEAQIARWAGFVAVVCPRQIVEYEPLLDRLRHHKPIGLISFGLAGGLEPCLRPGDLLLSTQVITPERRWQMAPEFRDRMLKFARELGAVDGAVFSSATIIASPQEKSRTWRETGALAVDMESFIVARAAHSMGIPFLVMRAIADPAAQELPPVAWESFSSEQGVLFRSLVTALPARPRQIPAVCALALQACRGLYSLSLAARTLAAARPFRGDPHMR